MRRLQYFRGSPLVDRQIVSRQASIVGRIATEEWAKAGQTAVTSEREDRRQAHNTETTAAASSSTPARAAKRAAVLTAACPGNHVWHHSHYNSSRGKPGSTGYFGVTHHRHRY